MTLLPLRPPVKTHPRPSAKSAEKSVAELDLGIEADSVLSVSSCKFLFDLLKNPLRLQRPEYNVVQSANRVHGERLVILVLENLDSPAG